ncbi:hypothetical protein IWW55_002119 [Coemansia sp. RSA 2706]|nr:hypothetical protein IWW55_002119 [Coemansia sp. RSA 2706]KAJ2315246.1 hypothetical protein IWW54_000420 [Coemansia sp. RSA 2705]
MESSGKGRNRDSGRGSMGLGIVLSNDSRNIDFERAAATMGLVTSQTPSYSTTGSNPGASRNSRAMDEHNAAPSVFARLISGISSFMATVDESDQGRPKTRIEDMLESYYIGQGREVPGWVYNPPPDPPTSAETRPNSIVIDSIDTTRVSSAEPSRETSAKPSSMSTNGVLRSFARLNISRLTRPGSSRAVQSSSASVSSAVSNRESEPPSEPSAQSRSASRLRRMWPHQLSIRSGQDSGFNSPAPLDVQPASQINVQLIDSGNDSSSEDTQSAYSPPQFMLDSSQLRYSASRSTSPAVSRSRSPFGATRQGSDSESRSTRRGRTATPLSREHSESLRLSGIRLRPSGRQTPTSSPQPKSKLSQETTPNLKSPSPVIGAPATPKRKMSASLPAWVNPAKWRQKSAHKAPYMADDAPGLRAEQLGEAKTSEPAPDRPGTFEESQQLRHTQSVTPRPGRVRRLFRRKHAHE